MGWMIVQDSLEQLSDVKDGLDDSSGQFRIVEGC